MLRKLFIWARRHQTVQVRICAKMVDKRNDCVADFHKPAPCFGVGDVRQLLLGNIQQFSEFRTVARGLIVHDDEFRIGKHRPRCDGIQQILDVLGDSRYAGVSFAKSAPRGGKKRAGVVAFKDNVKFVDKHVGALALLPVFRHAVNHSVGDNQQTHCFKLISEI